MKKKLLCFLLLGVLLAGLTGCGSNNKKNVKNNFDNSTIEKTIEGYTKSLYTDYDSQNAYKYLDFVGIATYQYLNLAKGYAISEEDANKFIAKYDEVKNDNTVVNKINNYAKELFTDTYYSNRNEDANSLIKHTDYEIKSQKELVSNLYSVKVSYSLINTENNMKSSNDTTYVLIKNDDGYYFVDTNSLYVTNSKDAYLAKVLMEN